MKVHFVQRVLLWGGDYSSIEKLLKFCKEQQQLSKPNREVFHKSSYGLVTFIALLGLI